MLCVTLKKYERPCAPTTGGISRLWMFDPTDFAFTKGVGIESYASVALRADADPEDGALMFPVTFQYEEASFKATQSTVGCSNSWDYELSFQLPQIGQAMTDFFNSLAAAACCCGLGLLVEMNDGTILVLGERYVGVNSIPRWMMKMDGTTLDSGKTNAEFNGANLVLKGKYSRAPNVFTGGAAAIEALETAPV